MKVIVSPEPLELGNTWFGVTGTGPNDIYALFQTKAQAQYHIDACNKITQYASSAKIVIVKVHS